MIAQERPTPFTLLSLLQDHSDGITLRECETALGPGTYAAMAKCYTDRLADCTSLTGDNPQNTSRSGKLPNRAVFRTYTITRHGVAFLGRGQDA